MIGILTAGGESGFAEPDGGKYYAYRNRFQPAPWTFAVWFPIFIGNLATAWKYYSDNKGTSLQRMAIPYCLALLLNASTPFIPIGYDAGVCFLLFLSLCWTLGRMYSSSSRPSFWAVRVPVVVFWTWAGVATAVRGAQSWVALVSSAQAISSFDACSLVLAVNFLLEVLGSALVPESDIWAYTGVLVWADLGIAAEQGSEISVTAMVCAAATALMALETKLGFATFSSQGRTVVASKKSV